MIFSTRSFDSTIRFIGFDLEESGLAGSNAYAQAAAIAGDNIALATIFEMIGYTSLTQTVLASADASPFGTFTVSEERAVGDFLGTLSANNTQLSADFAAAAALYASSLPVVTGDLAANVSSATVQSIFSDLFRSDHVGFWLEGYDALLLTDTADFRNPNYHQATDTYATLDFPYMTAVVEGSLGFLAG
ncbi:MAG: M28 family peptidase [bacterium]|nr:M28 family peptidase [bacterium]